MATTASTKQEEERRRLLGLITSLGIHTVLLLAIYFFLKLTPPNPPWGDIGTPVNFGFDAAGYGDVSTMETAGDVGKAPIPDQAAAPATTKATNDESLLSSNVEDSPVEVPDKPAQPTKVTTPVTTPVPTPTNKPADPVAKPVTTPGQGTGTGGGGGGANDGNVKGAVGNQGRPDGNPNELNYNGSGGNGKGGGSLQMTGWKWDEPPIPDDDSDATGKIIFEVTVDDNGEIVGLRVVERTVDPKVVEKYKKAVEKLTFSKTRDNQGTAATSKGRITFVLKGD